MNDPSRKKLVRALADATDLEHSIRRLSAQDSFLSTAVSQCSQNTLDGEGLSLVPVKDYGRSASRVKAKLEKSQSERLRLLEQLSKDYEEISRSDFKAHRLQECLDVLEWYKVVSESASKFWNSESWDTTKRRQECEMRVKSILTQLDRRLPETQGTTDGSLSELEQSLEDLLATSRRMKESSNEFKNHVGPGQNVDTNLSLRFAQVTSEIEAIQNSHRECHSEIRKMKETIHEENAKIQAPIKLNEELARAVEAKLTPVIGESFKQSQERFLGGLCESLSALVSQAPLLLQNDGTFDLIKSISKAFTDVEEPLIQTTNTSNGVVNTSISIDNT